MSNIKAKPLALIITAIKNIQSRHGPNPREILNYISSACDVPEDVARRQVLAALKRGTMTGILRETDGHYTIPNGEMDFNSIGSNKLGLLNLVCRKRKQMQRKKKSSGHCGSMRKKSARRGRSRSRKSKSRKMKGCGSSRRRKSKRKSKSRKQRKSRSKYDCGTKKSRKSKRNKRKKSKRGNCVCPEKLQRPETKSDVCSVKSEKDSNKCKLDFDDVTTNPHRKLSKSRSDCRSRTRSRGSRSGSRSRSRSSMYS